MIKESSEPKENLLELEFPSTTNIQLYEQKSFNFKSKTNGTFKAKFRQKSVFEQKRNQCVTKSLAALTLKKNTKLLCIKSTPYSNYKIHKNISDNE